MIEWILQKKNRRSSSTSIEREVIPMELNEKKRTLRILKKRMGYSLPEEEKGNENHFWCRFDLAKN